MGDPFLSLPRAVRIRSRAARNRGRFRTASCRDAARSAPVSGHRRGKTLRTLGKPRPFPYTPRIYPPAASPHSVSLASPPRVQRVPAIVHNALVSYPCRIMRMRIRRHQILRCRFTIKIYDEPRKFTIFLDSITRSIVVKET